MAPATTFIMHVKVTHLYEEIASVRPDKTQYVGALERSRNLLKAAEEDFKREEEQEQVEEFIGQEQQHIAGEHASEGSIVQGSRSTLFFCRTVEQV